MANPLEEMNFFSNPEELKSALMEQAHKVFFALPHSEALVRLGGLVLSFFILGR